MTVRRVRVRSAVNGRARGRYGLVPSLGEQNQNSRDHSQHEDQARDRDADREASLRYAEAVRIVDSLQTNSKDSEDSSISYILILINLINLIYYY